MMVERLRVSSWSVLVLITALGLGPMSWSATVRGGKDEESSVAMLVDVVGPVTVERDGARIPAYIGMELFEGNTLDWTGGPAGSDAPVRFSLVYRDGTPVNQVLAYGRGYRVSRDASRAQPSGIWSRLQGSLGGLFHTRSAVQEAEIGAVHLASILNRHSVDDLVPETRKDARNKKELFEEAHEEPPDDRWTSRQPAGDGLGDGLPEPMSRDWAAPGVAAQAWRGDEEDAPGDRGREAPAEGRAATAVSPSRRVTRHLDLEKDPGSMPPRAPPASVRAEAPPEVATGRPEFERLRTARVTRSRVPRELLGQDPGPTEPSLDAGCSGESGLGLARAILPGPGEKACLNLFVAGNPRPAGTIELEMSERPDEVTVFADLLDQGDAAVCFVAARSLESRGYLFFAADLYRHADELFRRGDRSPGSRAMLMERLEDVLLRTGQLDEARQVHREFEAWRRLR